LAGKETNISTGAKSLGAYTLGNFRRKYKNNVVATTAIIVFVTKEVTNEESEPEEPPIYKMS
jgi:hypothetical protein